MTGFLTIKPRALLPGALLGIVSPASAARPELVAAGVAELERKGYRTKVFAHALARGPLYYAGTVAERVEDLHAAFADPEVKAIVCTRGGWGSAELLPFLDAELIRANPKVFVGYSDLTSLQLWLRRECGLVCFYGPMVAADFAKADGVEWRSWRAALEDSTSWPMGTDDGLRVLKPGVAEGVLEGGCLTIVAESLGTRFAPRGWDGVLFLEDVGTKPYQWDRMLCHLRYSGLLEGVRGIVFGDMQQCVAVEERGLLEGAILHALHDFAGPVAIGLRCGHVDGGNWTVPLGVRVRLKCGNQATVEFSEAAVR